MSVAERDDDGFAIELDGKIVRTPARQILAVPTEALAELVAAEWDAQVEVIDPATMPVTRLVNTALDGVATDTQAVFEDILRFSASDLLCYRAEGPEALVRAPVRALGSGDRLGGERSRRALHPRSKASCIRNSRARPIAAFAVTLREIRQPAGACRLHTITTLTGSAILALAFAEGQLTVEEVWSLAHLDEDWTIEHWGSDEEAEQRRAKRFDEFKAAADVFLALSGLKDIALQSVMAKSATPIGMVRDFGMRWLRSCFCQLTLDLRLR